MVNSHTYDEKWRWVVDRFYGLCRLLHRLFSFLSLSLLRAAVHALSRLPWSCHFGLISAVLCIISLRLGVLGETHIAAAAGLMEEHLAILEKSGLLASFQRYSLLLTGFGILHLFNAVFFSFFRRRISMHLLRIGIASFVVLWAYALFYVVRVPAILYAANADIFGKSMRDQFVIASFFRWLPVMAVATGAMVCLGLRSVHSFYGASRAARGFLGDRIVENIKTHGKDPRFRTSLYWAAWLHILLIVGPLLTFRGCMTAYEVPKGSGEQIVRKVVVKRIKKKKRKLVLNMNSPILYYVPDLKDSLISQEIEQETLDTYQASSLKSQGKGKGGRAGWPHGMENAQVRFIRLEYSGGDWDQDMGKEADYNFLLKFRALTGFKIAKNTEHIRISDLARFPEKKKPPFVFVTGKGNLELTAREVRVLRKYCLEEGGMIFADNGGGTFNRNFRSAMRRVFPDLEWVNIASDDIIFLQPFFFPNGAPPLWHHSGNRAMGMKHNGRWVVFYHQGDLNDAWKTGHSGASDHVAEEAYRMGVNVVNYAFNQYMRINYGD